jgi:hypothetical protein
MALVPIKDLKMITAKAKSTVRIAKERASTWSCENPYHVDNVNVAQGPRTGNQALSPAKRSDFIRAKAEREPIADSIQKAYGARAPMNKVDPVEEPIRSTVKPKRFSR